MIESFSYFVCDTVLYRIPYTSILYVVYIFLLAFFCDSMASLSTAYCNYFQYINIQIIAHFASITIGMWMCFSPLKTARCGVPDVMMICLCKKNSAQYVSQWASEPVCQRVLYVIWHLLKFNQKLICVYVSPFFLSLCVRKCACQMIFVWRLVVVSSICEIVCLRPGSRLAFAEHKIEEDVKRNSVKEILPGSPSIIH